MAKTLNTELRHFLIRFQGRTKNAIGITYPIEIYAHAETAKKAKLELYETYEHITNIEIVETT